MERKNLIPALMLAALGILMIGGSIFIMVTSYAETLKDLRALVTFFAAGILLIAFAVYFAKTGGMSDLEREEEKPEDLGIEWEIDEEENENGNGNEKEENK